MLYDKDLENLVKNTPTIWFKLKNSESEFALVDYRSFNKAERITELKSSNLYNDSSYVGLLLSVLGETNPGTCLVERFNPNCEDIIYLKVFHFINDLTGLLNHLDTDFELDKKYLHPYAFCSGVELIGNSDDFLFMVQIDIAKLLLEERGQSGFLAINSPNKLKNQWLIHRNNNIAEPKRFLTAMNARTKKLWFTPAENPTTSS